MEGQASASLDVGPSSPAPPRPPAVTRKGILIGSGMFAGMVGIGIVVTVTVAGGNPGGSPGPPGPPGPGPPGPGPPTPPPPPGPPPLYQCTSDTSYDGSVKRMADKGMVIDDTTYQFCHTEIAGMWPNTQQPVKIVRSNAPWRASFYSGWSPEGMKLAHEAMDELVKYVKANDAKVFLGQDATCNETEDDVVWELNKELIKALGEEHIMGLAIGNEMDFLWNHHEWWRKDFPNCMLDLWDRQKFWKAFKRRVGEMDAILGSGSVPVTSVWTAGFSNSGAPGNNPPFMEYAGRALVRTFVTLAHNTYGSRWVWTFNPYPIWTPNLHLDPGTNDKCSQAIHKTRGPIAHDMIAFARHAIMRLTNVPDDRIWAGEYGWSNPMSDGMEYIAGSPNLPTHCKDYTSLETFGDYYRHFLEWDLSLSEATVPADRLLHGLDKAFFFTMRDSNNGAAQEHFGLIKKCKDTECKIQGLSSGSSSPTPPSPTPPVPPAPVPVTPPPAPPPPVPPPSSGATCKVYGCGGFVAANPCQCNSQCHTHGNCCPDYATTCGGDAQYTV